jgi:hypothetical protein
LTQTHSTTVIWFSTKVPKIYTGEKTASSTNCMGKTGFPLGDDCHSLSLCTSINSNWIKDVNISSEKIK